MQQYENSYRNSLLPPHTWSAASGKSLFQTVIEGRLDEGLGAKLEVGEKSLPRSFPSPLRQSLPVVPHICPSLLSWHTSQLSTQEARIKICFTLPLQLGVATWLYSEDSGQMQKPVLDRRRQTWPVFKTFRPFFPLLFFFKGVVLFIYFPPTVYSLYFSNPRKYPQRKADHNILVLIVLTGCTLFQKSCQEICCKSSPVQTHIFNFLN